MAHPSTPGADTAATSATLPTSTLTEADPDPQHDGRPDRGGTTDRPREGILDRLGLPKPLIWGFVGLALFMIGDGVETNILSPFLTSEHGFDIPLVGTLVTVYGVAVAVAAFFSAALSDLWGPRRVMMIGAGLWVAFELVFLLVALTSSSTVLIFVSYGLRGFGYPFFAYGFLVWIGATARADRMASAIGWFYVAFTAGLPTLGALVATGSLNLFGLDYYETLWVSLALVIAGSVCALVGVKERTGRRPLVTNPEEVVATLTFGFRLFALKPKAILVTLTRTINSVPTYGMAVFFPTLFTDHFGWSIGRFLVLTTVIYAVNIPFNLFFGWLGDRLGWSRTTVWFGAVLCAVAMLALYVAPDRALAAGMSSNSAYALTLVIGAVFGIGLAGFVPLSAIAVSLAPKHPGAAMSSYNLGIGAAVFAGPLLVALLYGSLGAGGLVVLFSVLYLVAAVMAHLLRGTQPGFDGVPATVDRATGFAPPRPTLMLAPPRKSHTHPRRPAMRLNTAALDQIAPPVAVPAYDRSAVTPGIAHFGVGGFHRSHQAMYLDRLMNAGLALDWGIVGMGVMLGDVRMRDTLAAQDGLYTLLVKNPDGTRDVRVIGSIIDYVYAPDDPAAAIERLADPAIRIVSLTITEGGYNFHQVTGEFDLDNPRIVADLAAPDAPATVFGLVCAALRIRRDRNIAPFTLMSCDNIQGNGEMARRSFTSYARALDPAFADWMTEHVAFPNSMVDRITPETTDADRADVADIYGIEDHWPVVSEDFTQWALEDAFVAGRPPYEEVGVQVVPDVEPYELMKLRLLNASHQGLCYFGWLAGYRAVHDVTRNPLFADFLLRYMREEAAPTLAPVPGVDLDAYQRRLIERFSNEYVADTVARLCAESSDRIPTWLMPVVRENLAAGRENVELSAAIVASWARYAEGTDEHGEAIHVVDRLADRLQEVAARQGEDIDAFLRERDLFGDAIDDDRFRLPYERTLRALKERGAVAALEDLTGARVEG